MTTALWNVVNYLPVTLVYSVLYVEGGICREGYGYPVSCPRPQDPLSLTRCCRNLWAPSCCREEDTTICAAGPDKNEIFKNGEDPGKNWAAVWCPPSDTCDIRSYDCNRRANITCLKPSGGGWSSISTRQCSFSLPTWAVVLVCLGLIGVVGVTCFLCFYKRRPRNSVTIIQWIQSRTPMRTRQYRTF